MKKRYFSNDNIHKIDGLLRWLSDKGYRYCASWGVERNGAEIIGPRGVISWYE
jgi:hypothetical protein